MEIVQEHKYEGTWHEQGVSTGIPILMRAVISLNAVIREIGTRVVVPILGEGHDRVAEADQANVEEGVRPWPTVAEK